MKEIWYEIRLSLAIEMLNWLIHVAPPEKDGLIIVKGAGNTAAALRESFEFQKRSGTR